MTAHEQEKPVAGEGFACKGARGMASGLAAIVIALTVFHAWPSLGIAAGPDLDQFWRGFFARPTVADAPAGVAARIRLGERLFHDARLSGGGARSCASCHQPDQGFGDGQVRGRGLDGRDLSRNVPPLYNLAWAKSYFWDGRVKTLEEQAAVPIEHPNEMAGSWPVILARLNEDRELAAEFAEAFGGDGEPVTRDRVLAALAAFEETIVSGTAPFDRFIAGERDAISAAAARGFRLFIGKAGCVACHAGWRFTDDRLHDIGVGGSGSGPESGAVVPAEPARRAFKTPGLRELSRTAPYMHDGSIPTLEGVILHYTDGIAVRRRLAPNLIRPLILSQAERADLIAFLQALDSKWSN